jgi:hypothetical protein
VWKSLEPEQKESKGIQFKNDFAASSQISVLCTIVVVLNEPNLNDLN